jgi:hypothetical protein
MTNKVVGILAKKNYGEGIKSDSIGSIASKIITDQQLEKEVSVRARKDKKSKKLFIKEIERDNNRVTNLVKDQIGIIPPSMQLLFGLDNKQRLNHQEVAEQLNIKITDLVMQEDLFFLGLDLSKL